jgi:hypothetical protein
MDPRDIQHENKIILFPFILALHLDFTFLLGLYFDRLGQKALYILMKFTPI